MRRQGAPQTCIRAAAWPTSAIWIRCAPHCHACSTSSLCTQGTERLSQTCLFHLQLGIPDLKAFALTSASTVPRRCTLVRCATRLVPYRKFCDRGLGDWGLVGGPTTDNAALRFLPKHLGALTNKCKHRLLFRSISERCFYPSEHF